MTDFERNKRSIASWAIALVFLVVAITTLSIFLDKADDEICRWGKRGYLEYGLVATITTMICLVVMIMINVFKNLKATVFSFLAAVVLIVEFCLTRYIAFVCVPCMLYEEEN
ncbi:uncharacterized protein LOC124436632 isoform X2 [Xenia sp. Carnegie-2017]|uniref:uncharacterized protein LOC124436632 isoform X2 n=1 Tax=Xenia sp. Carnegie-2017 TaxID=2897299 RepID=UPI001F04438B|nr:uncharacterized protein LOC124436632 isoform X2 [Xenia sp. Carnegie-2017]